MSQIGIRRSPVRKNKKGRQSSKTANAMIYNLRVFSILDEWQVEFYEYRKGNRADGWSEGFTQPLRDHVDNRNGVDIPYLETIGIRGYYNQVEENTTNQMKVGENKWNRYWILKVLEEPSSPTTRQRGLQELKRFFQNPRHTNYPPEEILMEDITDPEHPPSLDRIVRAGDVMHVGQYIFEPEDFDINFYTNFPHHARYVFGGPDYSMSAITRLGYPSVNPRNGNGVAYHPNFVPPAEMQANHPPRNDGVPEDNTAVNNQVPEENPPNHEQGDSNANNLQGNTNNNIDQGDTNNINDQDTNNNEIETNLEDSEDEGPVPPRKKRATRNNR